MSESSNRTGRCLCGAVKFEAINVSRSLGACHCSMCRRWTGGPFLAVDCGSEVKFEGEANITVFNSSDWADRGFCKKCGSNLFYRLKGIEQYQIPPGLFDDDSGLEFNHQVFVDERPDYYEFANKTSNMTGPEVYAKYAPPDD